MTFRKGIYHQPSFYNKPLAKKRKAIICDLDGTLTHPGERDTWDQTNCIEDSVCKSVKEILRCFSLNKNDIIIVTARPEKARAATAEWLRKHNIPADIVFHKPHDQAHDKEDAATFKGRLYTETIKLIWNVKFVMDDEHEVCKAWRESGLEVLQVVPPGYELVKSKVGI